MNRRALIVWCGFVLLAIVNGGLRDTFLTPRLGEHVAHVISTLTLSVAILFVTWLTIGWMRPTNSSEALLIGLAWVVLTVAFEFLAGHYVFGTSWTKLLADYNLFHGQVWPLVLATSGLAPFLMAHARALFKP